MKNGILILIFSLFTSTAGLADEPLAILGATMPSSQAVTARTAEVERDIGKVARWYDEFDEPPDEGTAERLAAWVADHPGDGNCATRLAELYLFPPHGRRRADAAWKLLQTGVAAKDAEAYALSGLLECVGPSIGFDHARNPQRAASLLQTAAEMGCADGYRYMATIFAGGAGVPQDLERCEQGLRKAISMGSIPAMTSLAMLLEKRGRTSEALEHAKRAADKREPVAQVLLGKWLLDGVHLAKDDREAFRLISQASRWGLPDAEWVLSQLYFKGIGTLPDANSGESFLKKSAEHGWPPAEAAYADFLLNDQSTAKPDRSVWMKWKQQAAKDGDSDAQFMVGIAYLTGAGVEKDEVAARKWLEMAANQKNNQARIILKLEER